MHVHHLALRTDDIPRLVRFYVGAVGLEPRARPPGGDPRSVWLGAGATLVMIEPRSPDEPPLAGGSMELVAFSIDAGERARVEGRLAQMGIALEATSRFTLYVRDPDGRRVGLSHFPDAPV